MPKHTVIETPWDDVEKAKKYSKCFKPHTIAWQNKYGHWLLVHPDGTRSRLVNKPRKQNAN